MKKIASFVVMTIVLMGFLAACTTPQSQPQTNEENRKTAIEERGSSFDRAEAKYPAPNDLVNFPQRGALVEFEYRKDMVNHPWYIYIMGFDGTPVGYYVGETYPINGCNFLSDTTQFTDLPDQQWGTTTAPSYDGMYYGGGGASSNCTSYFFFDQTTQAMNTFVAPMWFASDAPLNLDVPRLSNVDSPPNP